MKFFLVALFAIAIAGFSFAQETEIELPEGTSGYVATDRNAIEDITDAIMDYLKNISEMNACWKDSYGRGVGKPIHACPEGQDKDAGLCYTPCREGYKGVGPVCWEHCKSGYTDTGAFCTKWGKIISSNHKKCPWYDVCGLTFAKGCSKCPEHDPKYHNDGCTCRIDPHTYAKKSYGRGVGKPMGCTKEEEYDAGLCYKPCRPNHKGVGPVCWQYCPPALPKDNGALCCKTQKDCTQFIKQVSIGTAQAVAAAVQAGIAEASAKEAIKAAIEAAGGFVLFKCDRYE